MNDRYKGIWLLCALSLWWQASLCRGFIAVAHHLPLRRPSAYTPTEVQRILPHSVFHQRTKTAAPVDLSQRNLHSLHFSSSGYTPPTQEDAVSNATPQPQKKGIWPQIGDLVRFYDVDGGDEKGEVLVGRISFIQKNLGKEGSGWSLEIAELDDVGSGYFADYPFRKRGSKKTMRDLGAASPISASFVRSEGAYKVPMSATGIPLVRAETYDIDTYPGPFAGENAINKDVLQVDAEIYGALKSKLLRYTVLAGLAGTATTDLLKGFEDAAIYFAGAVASLLYLFLLTVKTDTVASQEAKMGSNVSNLRFVTPLILLGAYLRPSHLFYLY